MNIERRITSAQETADYAARLVSLRPAWWPDLETERMWLARARRDLFELRLVQAGAMIYADTQQALQAANWRMPEWGTRGT